MIARRLNVKKRNVYLSYHLDFHYVWRARLSQAYALGNAPGGRVPPSCGKQPDKLVTSNKFALEMGNTLDKLFRHSRDLVTPEAAKESFAIMLSPKFT